MARSTFSGKTLDGIPILSEYKIVYQFRLDGVLWPPSVSDLLKTDCPAILGATSITASLNSGAAYWNALNLSTVQTPIDSISLEMSDFPAHANDLLWNTLLHGDSGTMGADRDSSIDYSWMQGALFWPGAALTTGNVRAVAKRGNRSRACKSHPTNVTNKPFGDSLIAVAKTDRPWLTSPIVETVLPARFATVSWPKYVPDAAGPLQPIEMGVSVHVSQSGEPLVAVVHGVSDAPAFAAAALNAAMASTYLIPLSTDGAPLTQTFDIDYLYVPASAAAGKPVGLVSHDRSDGIRQRPHHD